MKTRVAFVLAAMALLAGCAKEIQAPVEMQTGEPFVLQVGINNSEPELESEPASAPTRTYLGDKVGSAYPVYWSDGDAIQVNDKTSNELSGIAAGTATTSFEFASGAPSTPYNILYPAGIYADATHVNLPAVQTYKAGGFANNMFPMAGYSADGSAITVSHLCAVVKVSVKRAAADADVDNIAAVRFKGRNSERVSGNFAITYTGTPALTAATGTGTELEVRVNKSLETSTSSAVVYYLVVPARTYSNGFDIIVQDANNHIMTKSKTGSVELSAGKMYNLAEFEFAPTGTELGVEIATVEDLINFATEYNAETYKALSSSFLATVTADLVFDASSSGDFNATGGIGNLIDEETTNYFNGVFNGNNHTISGYTGSAPLFAYTGAGGTVKDLTLAADCDKTIAAENSSELFGAFVGYHKGVLKNCISHADITFSNITVKGHYYGGLVGRNHGGSIIGCTMDGDVICPATVSISTAANQAGIGGIAGRSNASTSTIDDCHFNGNITISDGNTYGGITGIKGVNFFVGGIVGHLQEGEVKDCVTSTGTIDVRGTFNGYVGGIAGYAEQTKPSKITSCTNNMTVKLASDGGRSIITPTAVAGIAGRGTGVTFDKCTNNGAVSTTCDANLLYIGGITAMGDDSSFDGCLNKGSVTHANVTDAAQTARYLTFGGIVGVFTSGATKTSTIEKCKNYAPILCNQLGTSSNTTVDMGGIVGKTEGKAITITDCKNLVGGTLKVVDTKNKVAFPRTAVGGILGYSSIANTTISGCANSAWIWCQYSQGGTNNRPTYMGGIAGFLGVASTSECSGVAGLEIDDCHNTGCIQNQNYNNTVTLEGGPIYGGIVGAILGTDESKASIHDCSSATPAADSLIMGQRGISGGIVGYAAKAQLEENESSASLSGNNNAIGSGGIAGWIVGSTLTNCTFSGLIGATTGTNVSPKNVGGLVYLMDANSTVTGCKVNGATITKGTHASATAAAVLVNNIASGATIANCGVKGTLDGAPITLSSNMITTDGGATVTGTYLLP